MRNGYWGKFPAGGMSEPNMGRSGVCGKKRQERDEEVCKGPARAHVGGQAQTPSPSP